MQPWTARIMDLEPAFGILHGRSTFHLKAQLVVGGSSELSLQIWWWKGLLLARRFFGRAAMASKELLGIPDAPPGLLLLGQQQTEHRSRPDIGPVSESSSEYLLLLYVIMFLQKDMGTENFCPIHQAAHRIKHMWGSTTPFMLILSAQVCANGWANVGILKRVYPSLPGPLVS